ncbi:MAG: GNAT family N-acetyltransferase [Actinomycetia bacterium]|nr:GNAT family N-acetyltransferase [Actinomycetes bacterium]
MDAIQIRAATPDDADPVADYHYRCFTNTYSSQLLAGELEAPDPEGTRQELRDWLRPESHFETRVAVVDGAPIGHFTVRGHQLTHLFVEPDHQGMGLGRHLLAQGEARIAAGGHRNFASCTPGSTTSLRSPGKAPHPCEGLPGCFDDGITSFRRARVSPNRTRRRCRARRVLRRGRSRSAAGRACTHRCESCAPRPSPHDLGTRRG